MEVSNKRTFKVEIDGKEVELSVKRPSNRIEQQARLVQSREFCRLTQPQADGRPLAILRSALEGVMRKQGLWDDDKQKRWDELNKSLVGGQHKLEAGGGKLSEARAAAIQMRRDRAELMRLLAKRNELDTYTAEAQAEQARFNYLVSACTVYSQDGKPYFKDEQDYLDRADDPAAAKAAEALGELLYSLNPDFEKNLPENKFLLKNRLVRDGDLHLVDRDGKPVDAKFRRVNEAGQLVDDAGNPVDDEGRPLNDDGTFKVDFAGFEDDLGFGPSQAAVTVAEPAAEQAA